MTISRAPQHGFCSKVRTGLCRKSGIRALPRQRAARQPTRRRRVIQISSSLLGFERTVATILVALFQEHLIGVCEKLNLEESARRLPETFGAASGDRIRKCC